MSRKRLSHMISSAEEGKANVSASRVPVNAHPLWTTSAPFRYRKKDKLVLKNRHLKTSLQDNRELVNILQRDKIGEINGSQQLAPIFKVDACMVYIGRTLFFSGKPADFPERIIPWHGELLEEEKIPWMYLIPIFQMARDTKINTAPH